MRVVAIFLLLVGTVQAEQIRVQNANQGPIAFWVWDDGTQAWNQPIVIQPGTTAAVTLPANERRYLSASDGGGRECTIGWINTTKLLQRNPAVTLVIRSMQETVEVPRTKTILKPTYQQRTYQVPIRTLEWVDGCLVWVERVMTRTYTVRVDVPEQQTVMVREQRQHLGWAAYDDRGEYDCRITFRTENPGAYVRYKPAASLDPPEISKRPTETQETLNIGYYVVWCEREIEGIMTRTSTDRYYDVLGDDIIKIPETK